MERGENKRRLGRWSGLLALVVAAPGWAQSAAFTPEQLYDRISPSVWLVHARHADGQGMLGSAVVIAPGMLITNCHVVEKANTITVSHGTVTHVARLQYHDPSRDLCQLQADQLLAPVVLLAPSSALHPGQKVYAIGNPRGLELTISDGLVSGLRRDAAGRLQVVQISVPISPGSSGGGLFDAHGRLVGITTSGLRESQNLNFALPSEWVMELPRRLGGEVVATMQAGVPAPVTATATAPVEAAPPATPQPAPAPTQAKIAPPAPERATADPYAPVPGRVFEYRVRDRLTGHQRTVAFQVDRVDGERVSYNGGTRIEDVRGTVLRLTAAVAGEADAAMPPGGWIKEGIQPGEAWSLQYRNEIGQVGMKLEAHALGQVVVHVASRDMQALRVDFDGYTARGASLERVPVGRYHASAWYSPEMGRIVRFEVKARGGVGGAAFLVDEEFELIAVH